MAESASATFTFVPNGPTFDYSITLNDTGTTPIGTFWFAWDYVPDQDLMTSQPINVGSPIGWSAFVTHLPGTGYGIEWIAGSGAALTAGNSLTGFTFSSPDTPAMLGGKSQIDPTFNTTSSFVYQGAAFADPGFNLVATLACFRAGTRIRTERGAIAVETLVIGDRVSVVMGEPSKPVIWLGHRRVDCKHHPDPVRVWPIRVCAGAFGPGRPFRDLYLSPDHALFINGVLIPVHCLVNGRTIFQEACDEVTYWHVELAEHNVLYAEGVPAESYLDTGNRCDFANGGPVMHLHPDFGREVWESQGCAPLVQDGPRLGAARDRLLGRAIALGHATTDDPSLTVWANGRQLKATTKGRTWRVLLPRTATSVRLVSRVWKPAHTLPDSNDLRTLGVAISRLRLDRCEVELDGSVCISGWHKPESRWRWTSGDALLATGGARRLAFEVSMTGCYWQHEENNAAQAA